MPSPRTRLGSRGEALAMGFLQEKGYRVLAANYRCPWGEVDIIARHGEEVVFVEVRTRRGVEYGSPEESITPEKVERLWRACQHYLQRHGLEDVQWRIDLVSVRLDGRGKLQSVDHLPHAVEL